MDQKTQNEPEMQTEPESSEHIDSASAEKNIEQKTKPFESVEDESESIGLEKKAIPNHAIDNPETTGPNDKALVEDTGREPEDPDTEDAHDNRPLDANNDDNIGAAEKNEQSVTAAGDHDGKGMDAKDRVNENVSHSDSGAGDEEIEIQGLSEENDVIEEIDEKQEDNGEVENDDPAAPTRIDTETADAAEKIEDIAAEKTIETPARKNAALKIAVWSILIVAAFSGFFLFDNKSTVKANSPKVSKPSETASVAPKRHKKTEISKPSTAIVNSVYSAKLQEITALRDRLLLKQEEVMRLKKRYQDGIEELENEISDKLQKRQNTAFPEAMEDSAIAFTLRTIQRRRVYIQQLEGPSRWIHQACEELLYVKRRTMMDLQVAEVAGGIDMNKHMRQINAAVQKYQPTADKLAPDMTNAQMEPLETLWNRIQDKARLYASVRAHSRNQIISEQICNGIFNRLSELSEITTETAKCITEIQASDLYLNLLTEISPAAARQLFQWKGSWICLNGVRALSPRAAHYLFQWEGSWISLNGLTEFPAEIGERLLQWDGHQLELMGLQYAEDFPAKIALEYLARWEQAGGKLFVPKEVRKKIDELHAEST